MDSIARGACNRNGGISARVGSAHNPPIMCYYDFLQEATCWDRPRHVVAQIGWHQGELFGRVGLLVTSMWRSASRTRLRIRRGSSGAEQQEQRSDYL